MYTEYLKGRDFQNTNSNLQKRLNELDRLTPEDIFDSPIHGDRAATMLTIQQEMSAFIPWARTFLKRPESASCISLSWKELADMKRFLNRAKHDTSPSVFYTYVLRHHPTWIKHLGAFPSFGNELHHWFQKEPKAQTTLSETINAFQNFSDSLHRSLDGFFVDDRSPMHQTYQKISQQIYDERSSVSIQNQAREANTKLVSLIIKQYQDVIDEAIKQQNTQQLDRLTKHMQKETTIIGTLFAQAMKSDFALRLEDIRGISYEQTDGKNLTQEDKNQVLQISTANWMHQKPELVDEVTSALHEAFQNPHAHFYLLRKDEKVIAFLRSVPYHTPTKIGLKMSSLNVDPALRGFRIGDMFTQYIVDQLGQKNSLFADVLPEIDIASKYVEHLGFQIIGLHLKNKNAHLSEARFLLERPADNESLKEDSHNGYGLQETFQIRLPHEKGLLLKLIKERTDLNEKAISYRIDTHDRSIRHITFVQTKREQEVQQSKKMAA